MIMIRYVIVLLLLFASTCCNNIPETTESITGTSASHINSTTTPQMPAFYEHLDLSDMIDLSLHDMDNYLLHNETQQFLSSFPSGYQRDVIEKQLTFCPYTSLCGFSFGLTPFFGKIACCGSCSCDFPACMNNKTCCPDVIFGHIDMFNNTSVIKELPNLLVGQKVQKDCFFLYLSKSVVPSYRGAFAYATCPLDTDAELFRNCTRSYDVQNVMFLTDTLPVRSKRSADLYRNRYCALCNDELPEQFEVLDIKMKCSETTVLSTDKDILRAIYVDGFCDIEFSSAYELDYCDPVMSNCNGTGTFEDIVCSMYRSVITIDDIPFQNPFCAICKGTVPYDLTCLSNRIHDGASDFSFSGLLRLGDRDDLVHKVDARGKCSENQLYDYNMDSCNDMICSPIAVLKHGECVGVFENLEKITYTAYLRLKPTSRIPISDAFAAADHVIDNMRGFLNGSELCAVQMMYKSDMIFNESDLFSIENASLLYFDSRFKYYISHLHDPNCMVEKLLSLHNSEQYVTIKKSKKIITFKIQIKDNNPEMFDVISFMSQSDEINDGLRHNPEDTQPLNLTYLVQNYVSVGNDGLAILPHLRRNDDVGFCVYQDFNIIRLTMCPKVNISKLETPWKEVEDGVSLFKGDFLIASNEYSVVDEEHIMVCKDKYKQYMAHILQLKAMTPLSAESVISIVCSSLSILALCLTLFTFSFFSKLRETIPGKNNMSLISTLLSAQTLYLIGSFSGLERNSKECFFLGLLIHFVWLLALFWMNICTFHVFRVFTRTTVVSHTSGNRRFVIYHVYALIMAAIFVSLNICVSYITDGNLGYGRFTCYISSQRMIIYTFGIPAALIVLSNLFMFTYVVIIIKRSPSVQKNVQNDRNDIIVFAKLSTITGATWLFGLLYIWTNQSVISYMFIVLNASQGVFIMFAFVINKRVFDLFSRKLLGSSTTSSESGKTSKLSVYNTRP